MVTVVDEVSGGTFTEVSRSDVVQIFREVVPFVVATDALREGLRGDVLAAVETELEAVLAFDPAQVVSELIEVLNC